MFSTKQGSKSVISISDSRIAYITLSRDAQGFFISGYDEVALVPEIIKKGQILKPELLIKILKKLAKELPTTSIDVLLPHDHIECHRFDIVDQRRAASNKKIQRTLIKDNPEFAEENYCEYDGVFDSESKIHHIVARGIKKDLHTDYQYVCKQSGLKVQSYNSDLLALDVLVGTDRSNIVVVGESSIRIADFKKGLYLENKKFESSYQSLIKEVARMVDVPTDTAVDIIQRYGILRAHKDEKVYKRLLKTLNPFFDFVKKRKIKDEIKMYMIFTAFPIKGMVDHTGALFNGIVSECNIFQSDHYTFHPVLSLHKKDSYRYQSLIAQALRQWKK